MSGGGSGTVATARLRLHRVTSAVLPCVIDLGPNESYVVTRTTTQPIYIKDVH
jgi:hypothetical protein